MVHDKSDISRRSMNSDSCMDGNECDDDEEDDDHDVVSDDKMTIMMWLVMIRY